MKITRLALLAFLLAATAARAELLRVQLDRAGTNVVYRLLDKPMDAAQLKAAMAKLGRLGGSIPVHIQATHAATASDLVALISLLKDSGLTEIVVWISGSKDGRKGTYLMPMRLLNEPVQVCLIEEKRDFIPEEDQSLLVSVTNPALVDFDQRLAATERPAAKAAGPTPYPKDPAAWPGKGVIRVFDWMVQNRDYFWTQREKKQGAVVFAGDSLTGNWGGLEKAFPKLNVANRGIGGDVSRGLLFRFREDVLELHPKAVVILIGVNDLSARQDTAATIANLTDMLDMAAKQNAALPVVLCQVPPRASPVAPVELSEIRKLNEGIAKLAAGRTNVTLLDLFTPMAKPDGAPDPQYFKPDLLHLDEPGYARWRAALEPVFARLKLE